MFSTHKGGNEMERAESVEEVRKQIQQLRKMAEKHRLQSEKARTQAERTDDRIAQKTWDDTVDREVRVVETLERQIDELEHTLSEQ